ncbi:hypothetical protein UABHE_001105 [Candidatus Uabimicrobium helgolandensis]
MNIVAVTIFFSVLYAVLRYNVFGDVPWEQLPIYIVNKAISLSAIFCISLSVIWSKLPSNDVHVRKFLGLYGFVLAILHVLLSIMILSPEYYSSFFVDKKLYFFASTILLCGALAFIFFLLAASCSVIATRISVSYISVCVSTGMLFAAAHIFLRGQNSWKTPFDWYGYMPPISLVGFATIIMAFVSKSVKKTEESS